MRISRCDAVATRCSHQANLRCCGKRPFELLEELQRCRSRGRQLYYHVNTVRNRIYDLWRRMHSAGFVMPMTKDKAEAAVVGARLHGLV